MVRTVRLAGIGLAVAGCVAATACSTTITAGEGGEVTLFTLRVSVTNVGDGFGRVVVEFPTGTIQEPCPEILGPRQTCEPRVVVDERPEFVEVFAEAEPGSRFAGWMGAHCEGQSTECTVRNSSGEADAVISVEPRFDLDPAGS